jgi:aminoglycoside phosphotransferase (APT) family kinase protein
VGPERRPEAETEIDVPLVEALVADQHRELVGPVGAVASGWDNAVFRLGDDLAVRLPRRAAGVSLVTTELRWLPELARRLPLAIPEPVRAGTPGHGYPWPWSIVRWVPGETALSASVPLEEWQAARTLTGFLRALHLAAPADAPRNPYRGVPLADRVERFEADLALAPHDVERGAVRSAWAAALGRPPWSHSPSWVHGDLHPGNLVVEGARLGGVIDFGDLTAGDPATDLAVAWMLLGPEPRAALRTGLAVDDATWGRGRGWALAHSMAVLAHSTDDPAMAAMARRTLDAVLADHPGRS